jgi:hypothetical protein
LPFRFKRPALLIPWGLISSVRQRKVLWWTLYELDLAGETSMQITEKAYEALKINLPIPVIG